MGNMGDIDWENRVQIPPEEKRGWVLALHDYMLANPDYSWLDAYNGVIPPIPKWTQARRKKWFLDRGLDWHVQPMTDQYRKWKAEQ